MQFNNLSLNRHEVQEEMKYFWTCPNCKKINNSDDDPMEVKHYFCDGCEKEIVLFDIE